MTSCCGPGLPCRSPLALHLHSHMHGSCSACDTRGGLCTPEVSCGAQLHARQETRASQAQLAASLLPASRSLPALHTAAHQRHCCKLSSIRQQPVMGSTDAMHRALGQLPYPGLLPCCWCVPTWPCGMTSAPPLHAPACSPPACGTCACLSRRLFCGLKVKQPLCSDDMCHHPAHQRFFCLCKLCCLGSTRYNCSRST